MQPSMDYKSLYHWALPNLLTETSSYSSHEKIVTLRKSKCHFGKEDDWICLDPCEVDESVCCDEGISPSRHFCYFYAIVFKRVLLRLPLSVFEKELLTELNVAPVQLHPNWAFVRPFYILCDQLGIPPSVDVFLYLFEVKKLGRKLWVSISGLGFSIVVFKKINLVLMFFKMYPNWSFPLSGTLECQVMLMWQRDMRLRDLRCQERCEVSSGDVRNLASPSAASPPTGDDTIDALNVGEEEQEDAIDTEAATDEGVIHWAISKSSFMDDDDEGPFVGLEDVDMTVFGSNDMAVEEKMNSKMLQVKSVEDVLLLKGMGRRVSPLREGWTYWSIKKVFLEEGKDTEVWFGGIESSA